MPQSTRHHLAITGPEGMILNVDLGPGASVLGRQADCEVLLEHPQVSRQHARIDCTGETCAITDLGSANGTLVNSDLLRPNESRGLSSNARIHIGPFRIVYEQSTVVAAVPPAVPPEQDVPTTSSRPERGASTQETPTTAAAKPVAPRPVSEKPAASGKPTTPDELDDSDEPPSSARSRPQRGTSATFSGSVTAEEPKEPDEQPPSSSARSRRQSTPARGTSAAVPPAGPPRPPRTGRAAQSSDQPVIPLGVAMTSLRLMEYLPPIYYSDFMSRFLALFESVLLPIEWTVDNFDLFLSAATAPSEFLPWLSGWFGLVFDDTWSDEQRRAPIAAAHGLFETQGTPGALGRVLEIYTGRAPVIDDQADDLEAHTFRVRLPISRQQVEEDLVRRLIDAYKPAHTSYQLQFSEK